MFELAAQAGCGLVLMHIEGPPRTDREPRAYEDVIEHLKDWFSERLQSAAEHGVDPEQIALDPGLDFDLSMEDDLRVLARLGELRELGRPLYVSLSRKDFLGAVLAGSWEKRVAGRGAGMGDRRRRGAGGRRRGRDPAPARRQRPAGGARCGADQRVGRWRRRLRAFSPTRGRSRWTPAAATAAWSPRARRPSVAPIPLRCPIRWSPPSPSRCAGSASSGCTRTSSRPTRRRRTPT